MAIKSNGNSMEHFRVVIFGSARIKLKDPNWNQIYDLAKRVGDEDMDVVTGGGPGLMEAASEGHYACETNESQSIGLQIALPRAQRDARHLDIKKEFSRFSERLDNFMELANAVVVAPGGVGTMLELYYTWQLIQVKMARRIPIILLGGMWPAFVQWIKDCQLANGYLDKKDLGLLHLVKNNEEAMDIIRKAYEQFRLDCIQKTNKMSPKPTS